MQYFLDTRKHKCIFLMSSGESSQKSNSKPRKKRKTKRHASSPLNDTERSGKGDCVNVNGDRPNNGGLSTSNNVSNCSGSYNFDKTSFVPNMVFSQPFGGFPFSTQSPYPNPSQSPTLPQSVPAAAGMGLCFNK